MKSLSFFIAIILGSLCIAEPCTAKEEKNLLVRVNNQPIYESELNAMLVSHKIPREQWPKMRKNFSEQLVNEALLRKYLKNRKAIADPLFLEQQIAIFRKMARAEKKKLNELLKPLSLTEASLRKQLALPLAWAAYSRRVITEKQIHDHFKNHKEEFDGTKIQARQIFLKVPDDAKDSQIESMKETLSNIRTKIIAKSMSFSDAAKKHSQSPSAQKGGKLGTFQYRGRMPSQLSQAAFALRVGEVSQPFQTKFGLHLIQTTKRIAGQFSLEDARNEIFETLSKELKTATVEQLKKKAKIVWVE